VLELFALPGELIHQPARLVRPGDRTDGKLGLTEVVERREDALRRRARSPEAIR
jgi:hypothetical protein